MSFDWRSKDADLANAYREGWDAACALHLHRGKRGFHVAWPESESFHKMSDDEQRKDAWAKLMTEEKDGK